MRVVRETRKFLDMFHFLLTVWKVPAPSTVNWTIHRENHQGASYSSGNEERPSRAFACGYRNVRFGMFQFISPEFANDIVSLFVSLNDRLFVALSPT
jgi:hypothetical protein